MIMIIPEIIRVKKAGQKLIVIFLVLKDWGAGVGKYYLAWI